VTGLLIPDYHFRVRSLPAERQAVARTLATGLNVQLLINGALMVFLCLLLYTWQGRAAVMTVPVYAALLDLAVRIGRKAARWFDDQQVLRAFEEGPVYLAGTSSAAVIGCLFSVAEHRPDVMLLSGAVTVNLLSVSIKLAALMKLLEDAPPRRKTARRGSSLRWPSLTSPTRALVPVPVPVRTGRR